MRKKKSPPKSPSKYVPPRQTMKPSYLCQHCGGAGRIGPSLRDKVPCTRCMGKGVLFK